MTAIKLIKFLEALPENTVCLTSSGPVVAMNYTPAAPAGAGSQIKFPATCELQTEDDL